MNIFKSARDAKEFLISKIVEEAQREDILLSEPERKMLYFSETGWTLPDMAAASDEFDGAHDRPDYEKKIARLIRNAGKLAQKQSSSEYDLWWQAIRRLRAEDHYLLVMIRQAGLRPRGDLLKLWGAAGAVVTAFVLLIFFFIKFGIDFPTRRTLTPYVWVSACLALIVYQSLRYFLGAKRVDDWLFGLIERLIR